MSFSPFTAETTKGERGRARGKGPSRLGPGATPPQAQEASSICLHSWGACSAPHLRKKSTTRSSVYSGISGSQRELFSSEMKRKRTICQVNRRHCSPRCQGPFVGRPLRSVAPSRRESAYSKEMRGPGWRAGRLLQCKRGQRARTVADWPPQPPLHLSLRVGPLSPASRAWSHYHRWGN